MTAVMSNNYQLLHHHLSLLNHSSISKLFVGNQYGLEKESLRVNTRGEIAQTPHPRALGSALTHPFITTDYSEALLELITPPMHGIEAACQFLFESHQFVYEKLQRESLWATSMPCILAGETSIPIAQYGPSNPGMMKTIYRRGLGLRYGREMQVIAGVHFNFSLSQRFWSIFADLTGGLQKGQTQQDYISEQYFRLIRNLQRFGWMVPYLFGASPAVCKSFLAYQSNNLDDFDQSTYYEPYATSLRMGDIGYQNNKENESGIKANYDSVLDYAQSLECAIRTPYSGYQKFGIIKDGVYQQLNDSILQIENEYYSTIRPKQIPHGNERPALALKRRGVKYVELRSLDVNAYDPIGIETTQLYFLETFLLFCLLHHSPLINTTERREIDDNEMCVAHAGREPGLRLHRMDQAIPLQQWGLELCEQMQGVAELLNRQHQSREYTRALTQQTEKFYHPELTPSALMLEEMRENKESFHQFAARKSKLHQHVFRQQKLSAEKSALYLQWAKESLQKQRAIENSQSQSFEAYLHDYYQQDAPSAGG